MDEPTVALPASERLKSGKEAQYDAAAKALIATPEFMHAIVGTLIPDAKNMSLEDFKRSYKPESSDHLALAMLPTENDVKGEGKIHYDVLCALLDDDGVVMNFIDIEAQRTFSPDYSLQDRGTYYRARLLSSQFASEGASHMVTTYKNLKKVYSIWLCFNSPAELAGRIIEYKTVPHAIFGWLDSEHDRLDLGSLIMVYLPKEYQVSSNSGISREADLIDLLSAVFSANLDVDAKRAKMKEKGIAITEKVEGGVIDMCNLGEGIRIDEHEKSARMIFKKLHASVEAVAEMYPDLPLETLKKIKAECDSEKSSD